MSATAINLQYEVEIKPTESNATIIKFPSSRYTEELAEEICMAIIESNKGIAKLCKEHKHWPSKKTIFRWLKKNKEFQRMYTIAKEMQIHELVGEMSEILGKIAALNDRNRRWPIDEDLIDLMRLEMDKIKWKTDRIMPRKYGIQSRI